jgi:hypothetical protein
MQITFANVSTNCQCGNSMPHLQKVATKQTNKHTNKQTGTVCILPFPTKFFEQMGQHVPNVHHNVLNYFLYV